MPNSALTATTMSPAVILVGPSHKRLEGPKKRQEVAVILLNRRDTRVRLDGAGGERFALGGEIDLGIDVLLSPPKRQPTGDTRSRDSACTISPSGARGRPTLRLASLYWRWPTVALSAEC